MGELVSDLIPIEFDFQSYLVDNPIDTKRLKD